MRDTASHARETERDAELTSILATTPRIVDLLARGASVSPQADGLIYLRHPLDPDPVRFSFDDYMGYVKATETWFRKQGIGAGDGVAIFAPPSPVALFSIWGASACGVGEPLNLLFSREAIVSQLNAISAKILVTTAPGAPGGLFERVEGMLKDVPTLQRIVTVPLDGTVAFDGEVLSPDASWRDDYGRCTDAAEAERVAIYLPTGGTTGSPKVARLPNRAVVASATTTRLAYDLRPGDASLIPLPLFHVGGLTCGAAACCAGGACMIIPGPGGTRDPAYIPNFWRLVEKYRATHGGNVPTAIGAIAETPIEGADISSLRVVSVGGSICPPEIERRFLAKWGKSGALPQIYGMTEVAGAITHDFHGDRNKPGFVGTRAPLFELAILANGAVHREAPSPVGELIVRGPQVFLGYMDKKQTDGAMHEGWLRTGDLCRIDAEGYVEIMGRVKDIIIRGGHNIDPRTIEDAALEYPGVALAAAVGRPDSYAGEVPILFVTVQPGASVDLDALNDFVRERIMEPPARPRAVARVAEMPVTPVGKIFKPKLREIATAEAAREALAQAGLEAAASADAAIDPQRGMVLSVTTDAAHAARVRATLETFPVKVDIHTR